MTCIRKVTYTKFRIFKGAQGCLNSDDIINEWLLANPRVDIVDFRFNSNMDICIMYKETVDERIDV